MSDRFVNDVAKQLERRSRRRRLAVLGGFGALVAAAIVYLRCGSGWGIGGAGPGSGPGTGEPAAAHRCTIRVTAKGIVVDGKPATRDEAVATCKATAGALVIVAGDAREGDWTELEHALQAAHVAIDQRDR